MHRYKTGLPGELIMSNYFTVRDGKIGTPPPVTEHRAPAGRAVPPDHKPGGMAEHIDDDQLAPPDRGGSG